MGWVEIYEVIGWGYVREAWRSGVVFVVLCYFISTFLFLALCAAFKYVKALYHSFYICVSAEPEWGRCSTPRAQRTGSSTLWTDVWTG